MGNAKVEKKKRKQREREDQEFLIKLNKITVSTEDMTRVVEEVAKLDPEDRNFEGHSFVIVRYAQDGKKATAIMERLRALARLLQEEGVLQGWTLPPQQDGMTLTQQEVFAAAAIQPLVMRDGDVAFEREPFLQKVLEIAEPEGSA